MLGRFQEAWHLSRRTAGLLILELLLENICNWQIVRQGRADARGGSSGSPDEKSGAEQRVSRG